MHPVEINSVIGADLKNVSYHVQSVRKYADDSQFSTAMPRRIKILSMITFIPINIDWASGESLFFKFSRYFSTMISLLSISLKTLNFTSFAS